MMKSKLLLWTAAAALVLVTSATGYSQDKLSKLERGIANLAGGVVEIPGCVADTTRKGRSTESHPAMFRVITAK